MSQQKGEDQNQARRGKIQRYHDVPFVHPVRHYAADGRAQDGGNKRRRAHRAEQPGGPGLPQKIQRQGKAQDGVAEKRYDLPDYYQGEVPAEQGRRICLTCFHSSSFK